MKNLYENFHDRINIQKRIINGNNFTYKKLIKITENYLNNFKYRVLDIGCGAGTIDFYLAKRGFNVTGIDISQKAINTCKKNCYLFGLESKLDFFRLNFSNYEKINKKYDFIICSEVLEHIRGDKKAINLIYNIIKSNGIIVFSVPSTNAPLHKIGYSNTFDNRVGHLRRYSEKSFLNLFDKKKFKVIEIAKTEGVLRNMLFLNKTIGHLVKALNKVSFLGDIFTFFDDLTIPLFGESNLFFVVQKK